MKEQFTAGSDAPAMPAMNDKEPADVEQTVFQEETRPEEPKEATARTATFWPRRKPTRRLSDEEVKVLTDQYFADGKRITKCPPGQAGKA
jgi:hypothetical protein